MHARAWPGRPGPLERQLSATKSRDDGRAGSRSPRRMRSPLLAEFQVTLSDDAGVPSQSDHAEHARDGRSPAARSEPTRRVPLLRGGLHAGAVAHADREPDQRLRLATLPGRRSAGSSPTGSRLPRRSSAGTARYSSEFASRRHRTTLRCAHDYSTSMPRGRPHGGTAGARSVHVETLTKRTTGHAPPCGPTLRPGQGAESPSRLTIAAASSRPPCPLAAPIAEEARRTLRRLVSTMRQALPAILVLSATQRVEVRTGSLPR